MSTPESLPPTDALQQEPTPPLATLHFPDVVPVAPNIALPPNSTVWAKLRLLLHAHELARFAARRRGIWSAVVFAVGVGAAIPLGIFAGIGIFWLCYQDPHRHAQYYQDYSHQPWQTNYYIRGNKVTQAEYDYYLRNSNEGLALAAGILGGILTGLATIALFWLLLRPRKPIIFASIEEQIAAIAKDHPEAVAAWGGVSVLRVPQLIERLLEMQSKDTRR